MQSTLHNMTNLIALLYFRMTPFTTSLVFAVLYFATETTAYPMVCPPCLPIDERIRYENQCLDTPVCVVVKKRSSDCPPCIPLGKPTAYKAGCHCTREKRSTFVCPSCIPNHMIESYRNTCPEIRVCDTKRRDENTKRSSDCPRCIPPQLEDYYTRTSACTDVPVCAKRKVTRRSSDCPPCIPWYMVVYYKERCPESLNVCTTAAQVRYSNHLILN